MKSGCIARQKLHGVTSSVSWSIVSKEASCYGTNRRQKVLTEQDVTVIAPLIFIPGSMNISSVVPSSDTATDSMKNFEKVDAGDARLIPASSVPSGAYTRSF